MRYKVLIFDFDGTLADSFPIFLRAMNAGAEKFSYRPLRDEDLPTLFSMSARNLIRALKIPFWKVPRVGRFVKKQLTEEASRTKLFPETEETLRSLHELGFTLAILTSNTEANVRNILGESLSSCFRIYHCDVGVFGKKRELKRMLKTWMWRREDVLVIGDEIRDAEAAKKIKADFCAVAWGYTNESALGAHSSFPPLRRPLDLIRIAQGTASPT